MSFSILTTILIMTILIMIMTTSIFRIINQNPKYIRLHSLSNILPRIINNNIRDPQLSKLNNHNNQFLSLSLREIIKTKFYRLKKTIYFIVAKGKDNMDSKILGQNYFESKINSNPMIFKYSKPYSNSKIMD